MASSARARPLANSFKPQFAHRPDDYRTPPPPEFEPLSPIPSPSTTDSLSFRVSKKRKLSALSTSTREDYLDSTFSLAATHHNKLSTKSSDDYLLSPEVLSRHNQNAAFSPLDVFATVATSPSLDSRLFPHHEHIINGTGHEHNFPTRLPAHSHPKRTRSEQIDLDRLAITKSLRPATSHVAQAEWREQEESSSMTPRVSVKSEIEQAASLAMPAELSGTHEATVLEAELLLGFAMSNREPGQAAYIQSAHAPRSLLQPYTVQDEFHGEHTSSNAKVSMTDSRLASTGLSVDMKPDLGDEPSSAVGTSVINFNSPYHARFIDNNHTRQVPNALKPKAHKGWPKGKPRGPRSTNTGGKKSGHQQKKKATDKRNARNLRKSETAKKDLNDPWLLDVPEQPRVRPSSASGAVNLKSASSDPPGRSSVPPDIAMVIRTVRQGPGRPRVRKSPNINVCPRCGLTDNSTNGYHNSWVGCNGCKRWFHSVCAGFERESVLRDVDKYFCIDCEPKCGKTTFVRKSARAHVSVDYAGLNEGNLRTAVDVPEHHYIKPIKEGTLELTPESFPRMPPELVTADFFQRSGGMTEPVLIPAQLNPRPGNIISYTDEECDVGESINDGSSRQNDLNSSTDFQEELEYDCVADEGQDKLGMVIPIGLTTRKVSDLYGPDERVEVIDVKLQEGEERRWTMRQWADYYEAEGEKPVRNVISLEVSQSKLGRLIKRPLVVRNLDLQDAVWPLDEQARGSFPKVQFYCLMSVADCYTDFHIDFGGSSVYYHILKGRKTFFFIPPKPQHLKKYEEWCLSPNQNQIWLGNETKECYRVDLHPGDTMLIPSGWIHAVWTPENSLVIGGNFLTRMHYSTQLQINEIEKNTGVGKKFRYPYFQKIMWYALVQYLQEDPVPSTVVEHLLAGNPFPRNVAVYHSFVCNQCFENEEPEVYNSRYYSRAEIEGLPDLLRFLLRTVMIATGNLPGISKTSQEAVNKSMPKGYGDYVDLIKVFAMWIAWKTGNETIPSWAYPNASLSDPDILSEKKTSAAAIRAAERQAARDAFKASSGRRKLRSSPTSTAPAYDCGTLDSSKVEAAAPANIDDSSANQTLQKLACDDCRQRRVRCKHKDSENWLNINPTPFGIRQVKHSVSPSDNEYENNRDSAYPELIQQEPQRPTTNQQTERVSGTTESKTDGTTAVENSSSAPKRPRTKACEECRKSKRRCVHDQNGHIDPIKASEIPVPRGSRRPRVDENATTPRNVVGARLDTEHLYLDRNSVPSRPSQHGVMPSFTHFTPPSGFPPSGSSLFSPMSLATSGSIQGLFFEPRSAFDEMRSWSQQPIENSPGHDKPNAELSPRRSSSPSVPVPHLSVVQTSIDGSQTLSAYPVVSSMTTQSHGNERVQYDSSDSHSAEINVKADLLTAPSRIVNGVASKIQSVKDASDAIATSMSLQAPPFSPVTDKSTPSPVTMDSKDAAERMFESQSRTPSIPTHTNTTESNGRTASGHSSPLTEPDPILSIDSTQAGGRRQGEEIVSVRNSLELREHEDARAPTNIDQEISSIRPSLKREYTGRSSSMVVETKVKRPNSQSVSQEFLLSQQVKHPPPKELGEDPQSPSLNLEEDEDARFARLLQEEEFGLRRRRS